MSEKKLPNPRKEGKKLLSLDTRVASEVFQSYSFEEQLEIIEATRDPESREELYYLVPDCTKLVRHSKAEELLQVFDTMLGTGLTCGLLPTLSGSQFEKIINLSVWKDGKPDEETLNLWIGELAETDQDDLARLMARVDFRMIAYILKDRIYMPTDYKGMFIERGLIELEQLEFEDEAPRFIMETLWLADPTMFLQILREIFTETEYEPEKEEMLLTEAEEERDMIIKEFDKERKIEISEAELFQEVDLENLELELDDEEEEDESV